MTGPVADAAAGGAGRRRVAVWDPFVRLFHWSLAGGFLLNYALIDDDSAAHRWVGYAVAALVGLRILWGFAGPWRARFASFPPDPAAAWDHLRQIALWRPGRPHASHSPLGALMVYNLLACMLALGLTGWMMTTTAFFGVEWVEELHEAVANWAMLSVIVHVGAVFVESRRLNANLLRGMTGAWPWTRGPR